MTDALKAMVEAMVAEIERQVTQAGEGVFYPPDANGGLVIIETNGLDLEKVARAGLAAINVEDAVRAYDPNINLPWWFKDSFAGVIDAILEDTP